VFPIRNDFKLGDALSPMLFNFALNYAIRSVEENQDGLKLNGTHQLLVNVNSVNILVGSVHSMKKNIEALLAGSKQTGLDVNAEETKYIVISRDQNAGRIHNIKTDNSSY
jgi:hypothetical protein